MAINYEGFVISLEIMWKGMLGLFIVSTCIMLLVMAVKFFFKAGKRP